MSSSGFMFAIGGVYKTQDGRSVRVLSRQGPRGYEHLVCDDGMHRYDRKREPHDAGRVTGTAHDYSDPGNFVRQDPPRAKP